MSDFKKLIEAAVEVQLDEASVNSKIAQKLSKDLEKFVNDAMSISDLWGDLQDEFEQVGDFNSAGDLGTKKYPFKKDFFQLANDIEAWVNTFKSELKKVK